MLLFTVKNTILFPYSMQLHFNFISSRKKWCIPQETSFNKHIVNLNMTIKIFQLQKKNLLLARKACIIVFARWGQSLHYNQNQTKESRFVNAKHTSLDRNRIEQEWRITIPPYVRNKDTTLISNNCFTETAELLFVH